MKIILKLLAIVFVFSLTGCFKVEMNSVVKTDGTIDVNATYDLSSLKNLGAFGNKMDLDCNGLTKNDYVKPDECKETGAGIFGLQWKSLNGENFEALRISNSQIFKTRYELNVKSFMRNFEPGFESEQKQKDLAVIKNTGATYKLNISMPGNIVESKSYTVNNNVAQVDIFAIYSDQKDYIVVSEKYNYLVLAGLVVAILSIIAFIVLRNKRNKIVKFAPVLVGLASLALIAYGMLSKDSVSKNGVNIEENTSAVQESGAKYTETNLSSPVVAQTDNNASAAALPAEPSSEYASKEQQEIINSIQTTKGISSSYTLLKIQSNDFAIADKALNDAYKNLKTKLSADEQEELKNEQLEWIKIRDNRAVEASQKGWSHLESTVVGSTNERMQNLSKR